MRQKKQKAVYIAIGAALGLIAAVYQKTLAEIGREVKKQMSETQKTQEP